MTLSERATKLGLMGASLHDLFDRIEQLETQLAEEAEAHAGAINAAYVQIDELERELAKHEPVAWMIEPIKYVPLKNMVRELIFYEPAAKADWVKVQLYRKEDV